MFRLDDRIGDYFEQVLRYQPEPGLVVRSVDPIETALRAETRKQTAEVEVPNDEIPDSGFLALQSLFTSCLAFHFFPLISDVYPHFCYLISDLARFPFLFRIPALFPQPLISDF